MVHSGAGPSSFTPPRVVSRCCGSPVSKPRQSPQHTRTRTWYSRSSSQQRLQILLELLLTPYSPLSASRILHLPSSIIQEHTSALRSHGTFSCSFSCLPGRPGDCGGGNTNQSASRSEPHSRRCRGSLVEVLLPTPARFPSCQQTPKQNIPSFYIKGALLPHFPFPPKTPQTLKRHHKGSNLQFLNRCKVQRRSRPKQTSERPRTAPFFCYSSSFASEPSATSFIMAPSNPPYDAQASTNYKEAFALYDKRGTQRVPAASLGDLLRACGQNPTLSEIRDLEKTVGPDCECDPPFPALPMRQVFPNLTDIPGKL